MRAAPLARSRSKLPGGAQLSQIAELVENEAQLLKARESYEQAQRYMQARRGRRNAPPLTAAQQSNPSVLVSKIVSHFQHVFDVKSLDGARGMRGHARAACQREAAR